MRLLLCIIAPDMAGVINPQNRGLILLCDPETFISVLLYIGQENVSHKIHE